MTQIVEDLLTLSRLEAQGDLPRGTSQSCARCWQRCAAKRRR
jgi:hypothetical protein